MNYKTIEDLSKDIKALVPKLPADLDLIVGVPRSGLLAANLLALYLNLPLTDVDGLCERRVLETGLYRKFGKVFDFSRCKKVLVIDDSIHSGASMKKAKSAIQRANLPYDIYYAAVYATSTSYEFVDFWCEVVDQPRCFGWNVMHHPHLENNCVDLDGVICRDPTDSENDDGDNYRRFLVNAEPLARPSVEIGWIVTCRLEKYRDLTEKWLKGHGIRYRNLVMMDLPDKESRLALGSHASFKAEAYKSSQAILFIESSFNQAQEIARISGKDVLCTETNQMISGTTQKADSIILEGLVGGARIKIAAVTMVYNEALLLPYFLRHYEHLDEIYVLYETDSTDDTLKILKQASNVIIKNCHIEGGLDSIDKVNLTNDTLHTIKAAWVYVVDCDEFIFPPQESPEDFLSRQSRGNYNVVRAGMFQVYRHRTDKDLDPSLLPIPQRVHGDPDLFSTVEGPNKASNALYAKPIVVKPSSQIRFQPGNHVVEGDVRVSPELYIGAHWLMADPSIAIDRRIKNKMRISERNKRLGMGWHYQNITEEWIREECDRHLDDPLIEELYLFSDGSFMNTLKKIRPKDLHKLFKLPAAEDTKVYDFFSQLIHQLTTRVKDKAIAVAELENQRKQLEELQTGIKTKAAHISELETSLQENVSQIHSLESQIQQIQRSIPMQVVNRYQRIIEKLLHPGTRRRRYYERGLTSIRIILSEGWKSFFRKVKAHLRGKRD